MMKKVALEKLTVDVQTIREKTANLLENISSDLRVLKNSSPLEAWILKEGTTARSTQSELQQMNKEVLAFAKTKGIYYQFRLIGRNGDELLRVECINPNDSAKAYRIVPQPELRQGRESYYFLMIQSVGHNQVTLAPAELLYKTGERIPVMSFAMPLAGERGIVGILIANVFEKEFIRVIESKKQFEPSRKIILTTGDGHYLYHSEKKKDWNRLLASREEDNLQRDYSPFVAASTLSGSEGTITEGADEVISYAPLFPQSDLSGKPEATPAFSVPVFVIESVPESAIMGPVRSSALTFIGFLVLFLGSAIGLGLVATRQFTRPIAQVQRGAEIIAKGSYGHRLHVETHDEIEKLADQFNVMASSLEAHEKEIQQHRNRLEEMVERRTRELLEEKTKLQALLDNVPSAFVLLDKDFRIQTVSAAFASLTGYALSDVKDKDCGMIFQDGDVCKECLCRKAVQEGMIESRVEHMVDRARGERFIERIAIPMKENGKVGSVLQIITDVTKRKRLEQELVHTEKLTAAGEMSSIIAHEFRNSLTSIKMILQLLAESSRISRPEKKSLGVALDSMRHMEGIVIELLDFARPKQMQMTEGNLNEIVRESLEFVTPHLKEKRVEVTVKLEPRAVILKLDASRMKEATINILLNAIQAIDTPSLFKKRGRISVATKMTYLQETLRELAFTKEFEQEGLGNREPEIIIKKGTACALVEIGDTGCGIEKDQEQRIFDPFYTTKTNGTGLGLPLVKRTVNAHRGAVKVESVKGKGTTFRIYLPLHHDT
ncbi:MAG: PAS domain S-box protein [Ignavibacteriales bacterium]|nr:PAS domain S-box protein [Ignavibacteriales bacterium]